MAIDWLPRDNELKNHSLFGDEHFGKEAPCTVYEKRPLLSQEGKKIDDLYVAWITLNNPAQYNSYTTEMVKGVIAGFQKASSDRSVVAVVFTGAGDKAFCSGGNTVEYAQYYSRRPNEYGEYMDLFNAMVDGILNCKKPVICRVNGLRVAGGQEIGMACDVTISSDLAVYGQAGPKHGSAPDGGATDFLPFFLSMEDAMWNCISCETWSAYKMKMKGLITKVVPVLKKEDKWVRNPLVYTEEFIRDGDIIYGEFKEGKEAELAKELIKSCSVDFQLLDKAVNDVVWKFVNLFPGCLMKSIDSIRSKKRFFWDIFKTPNRYWLSLNMNYEAMPGFYAFSTRKVTGKDVIDFVKFRQLIAKGALVDDNFIDEVMPEPKK